MIFGFLVGLNCKRSDWEAVIKFHNDYRWYVKLGYWARINIFRKDRK